MGFFFASLLKDLSRWRRDGAAILLWLGIPLMIGGLLMAMAGGGGGAGPSGTLLIADQDDSLLSGLVVAAYSQDQLGELLEVRTVSEEEGSELILAGDASGFLTIPAGFQDAFLNDSPVVLVLKTNPSQTILPGIIEDVTEIVLDAGFYLQTVFGDELAEIQDVDTLSVLGDSFSADIATTVQAKMEILGPSLSPPLLDVTIIEPPPTEVTPDIRLLFLPGIVMMALLFTSQGLSSDFWKERSSGTLRRLVSTSSHSFLFVLGKAVAAAIVIMLIAGVTMALGFAINDVQWSKFLPSMLWVGLSGIGFFAWFAALQMMFPNQKIASLLTGVILFPLLMMGGSFFPLDTLPNWLAAIGRLSPNGFVVDQFTSELTASSSWSYSVSGWLIVASISLLGLFICSWRLQSGFANR